MIGELDAIERGEEDPKRLAQLFELDHLATRMRRNDENLLVLAGADSAAPRREDALLVDVLRAAQSEVELYNRIEFGTVDTDISVAAHAVNDVVRLVAELLDNATRFSPPNTTVVADGRRIRDYVLIQIEDRGLGLTDEQLDSLNRRLAAPPTVDVAAFRLMGLAVVSRLAPATASGSSCGATWRAARSPRSPCRPPSWCCPSPGAGTRSSPSAAAARRRTRTAGRVGGQHGTGSGSEPLPRTGASRTPPRPTVAQRAGRRQWQNRVAPEQPRPVDTTPLAGPAGDAADRDATVRHAHTGTHQTVPPNQGQSAPSGASTGSGVSAPTVAYPTVGPLPRRTPGTAADRRAGPAPEPDPGDNAGFRACPRGRSRARRPPARPVSPPGSRTTARRRSSARWRRSGSARTDRTPPRSSPCRASTATSSRPRPGRTPVGIGRTATAWPGSAGHPYAGTVGAASGARTLHHRRRRRPDPASATGLGRAVGPARGCLADGRRRGLGPGQPGCHADHRGHHPVRSAQAGAAGAVRAGRGRGRAAGSAPDAHRMKYAVCCRPTTAGSSVAERPV